MANEALDSRLGMVADERHEFVATLAAVWSDIVGAELRIDDGLKAMRCFGRRVARCAAGTLAAVATKLT
jgi:hypothetical protein